MRYFIFVLLMLAPAHMSANVHAAYWKNRGLQVQVSDIRVIDGDTFDAVLALADGQGFHVRVRLADIDTPELRGKCDREKRLARAAKAFAADWLSVPPVMLDVRGRGRYGRLLAAVQSGKGDLAGALMGADLARLYKPGKKPWCAS